MTKMQSLRVYADTSVFGGVFDEEFAEESCRFFDLVRARRIVVLVSQVIVDELAEAPPQVRETLESLPPDSIAVVDLVPEIIALREAYLDAGIVNRRFMDDATHVAAATVARADAIVSWNFRHIVRLDKMRAYNQVNAQMGYGQLSNVSPLEVRIDENEE